MLEHRGRAGTEGFRPALLCLWLWLWVGLVFRAPFDPAVGPGCLVRPWAAARLLGRAAWCTRGLRPVCLAGLLGALAGGVCGGGLLGALAGGGPPARSPHASLTARSGRSRSLARPRRRPRPPQPGPSAPTPPTSAAAGPRLEAWSGPAGAHGRRSQAPSRSLARPLWRRPQISAHTTLVSTSCSVPSARKNSPCVACCLLVREKIRPVWLVACLCAKKFALLARKRRKTPFLGVLGELFRGSVVVWVVLGELFRGTAVERGRWESFVPGLALGAVQSSPCWGAWWCERYKVLPARAKRAEMGNFGRVG